MQNEKILILTGNYGEGHLKSAAAIRDSLKISHPSAEPIILDVMELTNPYFQSISRYIFLKSVKKLPSVYGYLYRKTRPVNPFSQFLKKLNHFGLGRLLNVLETMRPKVVISTFPIAAGVMSFLKTHGLTDVPTATIITDYTVHSYWVYPLTDLYIVGSDEVKQGLLRHHISSNQISVTGIPVRLEFSQFHDSEVLKKKHNLDPSLPTVLLMGGGLGLFGEGLDKIDAFEQAAVRIQLIIVCGRNEKLKQQLNTKLKHSKHRIVIIGYTDCVHELMAVADLLVTKAGGLTISEAMTMELPMIVYKPLPGQEEDNVKYLLKSGTALHADTIQELVNQISECFLHPNILKSMREKSRKTAKRRAGIDAAEVIWQLRYQTVSAGMC
jgi:processive 1,2-diacylglycerol beta-glucosyltransferase